MYIITYYVQKRSSLHNNLLSKTTRLQNRSMQNEKRPMKKPLSSSVGSATANIATALRASVIVSNLFIFLGLFFFNKCSYSNTMADMFDDRFDSWKAGTASFPVATKPLFLYWDQVFSRSKQPLPSWLVFRECDWHNVYFCMLVLRS